MTFSFFYFTAFQFQFGSSLTRRYRTTVHLFNETHYVRGHLTLPLIKMILKYVSFLFFVPNFLIVHSQDMFYPDNLVIGNLRRREVIPLNTINNNNYHNYRRRFGVDPQPNLNYRRTKDIREEFIDRRFEVRVRTFLIKVILPN